MKNEIELLKSKAIDFQSELFSVGLEDYNLRPLNGLLIKGIEKILYDRFECSHLPDKYQDITKYCLENENISEKVILELKKKADKKEDADRYEALLKEAFYLIKVNQYSNKARLTKRNSKSLSFEIYAHFASDVVERLSQMVFLFTGTHPDSNELKDKVHQTEGKDQNFNNSWSGKFQLGDLTIQLYKNQNCAVTFQSSQFRDNAFNRVVELARKSKLNNSD